MTKVTLELEEFNMENQQWQPTQNITVVLEDKKFSAGGFRDAFMATDTVSTAARKWVLKGELHRFSASELSQLQ